MSIVLLDMQRMQYSLAELADDVRGAIDRAEAALRLEQAVRGLDSLDELGLQSVVAGGLVDKYEVAREVHYPSSAGARLSHRKRCDLVLSPRGRPLRIDSRPAGLFDHPNPCPPGEALWIEVKAAYQFREGGVRHGGYGAQWRTAVVEDLRKIESEPLVREAALLLLVFTESLEVLEKDLQLFEDVLVTREVLAGFRQVRSVGILDRIGHRFCTAALWPTVQR